MKVGVSSVNITPPIGVPMAGYAARKGPSIGIHDDLYAKAIVFDDEETKAALIRCDLLWLEKDFIEKTRRLIESEIGIAGRNILITCTHTHSGPITDPLFPELEAWMDVLSRKIKGAVFAANRELRDAKIGFGKGSLEGIVINRRRLEGPVDAEVNVIRIDDLSGNPMAALINYTCHAVVLGSDNLFISADYPGYVMRFVEKNLGIPALFVNGACGDINPLDKLARLRLERKENIYNRCGGTFGEAERLGSMIGAEAVRILLETETIDDLELKVLSREVKIPLEDLPTMHELKKKLEENEEIFRKSLREKNVARAYAASMTIRNARNLIRCIEGGEEARHTEIQVFRIGDDGIVGLPGEIFVEIGLNIKKKSDFSHTIVCELSNDAIGYVPTREAFMEQGYEVGVARNLHYTDEVGCIIESEALKTLEMI